jgi:hypothetical protein
VCAVDRRGQPDAWRLPPPELAARCPTAPPVGAAKQIETQYRGDIQTSLLPALPCVGKPGYGATAKEVGYISVQLPVSWNSPVLLPLNSRAAHLACGNALSPPGWASTAGVQAAVFAEARGDRARG